jgi:nucleotide-binding universal stress UspA family protein
MFEKILLATDGSDSALDAARKTVELQKKFGSQVVIFHAEKHYYAPVDNQPRSFPFIDLGALKPDPALQQREINKAFKVWGVRMLEKTKEIFDKESLEVEIRLIETQGPVDYAKEISKKENFDLIVVGCKGHHSKLREIFIGSVAQKISNEAYCDVLVVR